MKKAAVILMTVIIISSAAFFCPVNAATNIAIMGSKSQSWENGTGTRVTMFVVELYPPNDEGYVESTQGYNIFHKTILVQIKLSNLTSQTRYFYNFWPKFDFTGLTINNGLVNYVACTDVVNYSTDFMLTFNDTDSYIEYTPSVDFSFMGNPCVPANSTLVALAKMEFAVTVKIDTTTSSQLSWNQCRVDNLSIYNNTYESPVTDFTPIGSHADLLLSLETIRADLENNGYGLSAIETTLQSIESLLQDIHDNMGSQDYGDTISDSNDLQTTEETIHQQEQQWYSDNKTAIEATGLGNYQYSPGLIDSFGVARYQIAMLWNALGDWTYVYYLVFLLGLAVYIIRHEPTMRVKQMRADREARMQENQIYTNASRNVRMSRDADYARHVSWGFRSRRK